MRRGGPWLTRAVIYLCGTLVLLYVANRLGAAHYKATDCKGDCGFAGLEGLVWSVIALPVSLVAVLVIELVLHRRREAKR
ncbi:hypothetical protein [Kribbella antiqua]|nr:hypothetical protein [Kribbella antiqua]